MNAASALRWVLWGKVLFTVFGLILPLFLLSPDRFSSLGFLEPPPRLFARLLGAAFIALLVGYLLGLRDLSRGRDVRNVVRVGIVSNGLGCLVLLVSLLSAETGLRPPALGLLWAAAAITGAITIGLVTAGLWAGGAAGSGERGRP
jgi:hypothetical protein